LAIRQNAIGTVLLVGFLLPAVLQGQTKPERPNPFTAPFHDRSVGVLTSIHAAMATWDYAETRLSIKEGGIEQDPIVRPLAHNTPMMVAFASIEVLLWGNVGDKLKHSHRPLLRKVWWVPQVVAIGAHIGCGIYTARDRAAYHDEMNRTQALNISF
jgi:hypothetical protein